MVDESKQMMSERIADAFCAASEIMRPTRRTASSTRAAPATATVEAVAAAAPRAPPAESPQSLRDYVWRQSLSKPSDVWAEWTENVKPMLTSPLEVTYDPSESTETAYRKIIDSYNEAMKCDRAQRNSQKGKEKLNKANGRLKRERILVYAAISLLNMQEDSIQNEGEAAGTYNRFEVG
jgi:hypothetical protein